MDIYQVLVYTFFIVFLLGFVLLCLSDGDLSLMFWDKFGRKLGDLKGKVIWITGASTGIGAALAKEAAEHGAKLVLSARSEERLNEIKRLCLELGRYHHLQESDILVLPLDMCDVQRHKECVDKVMDHFGKLSVVIHNAGRSQRARWEHTDLEVDKEIMNLNCLSAVNLSRLIIPHFLSQGGGSFAIMSSLAGMVGVPFSPSYTGSKHAIQGYFESLRTEKAGTGIRVNILCPGPVFSNLLAIAATESPKELFSGSMSPTDRRMTAERCAHLSLVAIAHNLEVSWMALFPILPMYYFTQYMPTLSKRLIQFIGPKYILKLRDSRDTMKGK